LGEREEKENLGRSEGGGKRQKERGEGGGGQEKNWHGIFYLSEESGESKENLNIFKFLSVPFSRNLRKSGIPIPPEVRRSVP
jgi:hypothetical protein